jgi:NADH dehydrogenase FAD-containing subunit
MNAHKKSRIAIAGRGFAGLYAVKQLDDALAHGSDLEYKAAVVA